MSIKAVKPHSSALSCSSVRYIYHTVHYWLNHHFPTDFAFSHCTASNTHADLLRVCLSSFSAQVVTAQYFCIQLRRKMRMKWEIKKWQVELENKMVLYACLMLIGFLNCLQSVAYHKIPQQEWSASHFWHVFSQFNLLSGSSNTFSMFSISRHTPRMIFMALKSGKKRGNKYFY